ncbi:MAG: AAA family ATPase [Chloroflexota bacterium]
MTNPSKASLRGVVERITFHNEENGYTVAKLLPERKDRTLSAHEREIPIIGNMAGINVGESVELLGQWTVHPEYGRQFLVEQMRTVLPATITGIEKYLGSGLIKGIGPVMAKRIVKHFGHDTLTVIEDDPARLIETPGIGGKRVNLIRNAWAEQKAIKDVMIFLQGNGVSTSLATRIYKQYGDEAIGIVKQDPYRLAQDIFGIGFLTADKIAQSMGIAPDAPQRVAAGIAYALNQATDDGHVLLPTSELLTRATELLEVAPSQAGMGIVHLLGSDQIRVANTPGGQEISPDELYAAPTTDGIPQLLAEPGQIYAAATQDAVETLLSQERSIYLTSLYYSEMGVANRLLRLETAGQSALERVFQGDYDWEAAFNKVERQSGLQLASQQRDAVQMALTHRLTVLTGGPGTGKTTTVNTLLHLCREANGRALLAAPTGRAAKRLSETTGEEAKTLHRLLEFSFSVGESGGIGFKRNEESPLEADLLIVDEASMLDTVLTNHLLRAIPLGMHLLLVGDVDQLPSVGAGNVLKDIIRAIEGEVGDQSFEGIEREDTGEGVEKGMGEPEVGLGRVNSQWPSDRPQGHLPGRTIARTGKVIRLQTIFRQAAGSYIISNAHRINKGQTPVIDNEAATDFFLFRTEDPERAAKLCVELVQSRIPKRFAIPSQDIQVLSPMHRGVVGVGALNESIQLALNPQQANKPERRVGNRAYRLGDRVMQIRNNYDKDVYNGDMGIIQKVDPELQKLTVEIDGRAVLYDYLELDELIHAYAISVHKSQGSEFPAVVIPVLTTHYMMLQRNLIYTAITRARRLVVLVGQPKAIALAVKNNKVTERHTGLRERLSD